MDHIPEELLLVIFKIHVWCNLDTPQRLLRVCRRWHNVTINAGSLWGDIILTADHEMMQSFALDDPSISHKTCCYSIESLARAIGRTQRTKFELTIALSYHQRPFDHKFDLLQPSWFAERCRTLRILKYNILWPEALFKNIGAMERLEVNTSFEADLEIVDKYLDSAQRTSTQLWWLLLRVHSAVILERYPSLAARITFLHIEAEYHHMCYSLCLEQFSVLETLRWSAISYYTPPLRIPGSIPTSLHTLSIRCHSFSNLPLDLYLNLKTLHYDALVHSYLSSHTTGTFEFPILQHLTINGCWNSLSYIRAPSLRSLSLLDRTGIRSFFKSRDDIDSLPKVTIRPTEFEVDSRLDEANLRTLLSTISKDIEELQINYVEPNSYLQNPLTLGFFGMKNSPPICPNLRRLSVLSSFKGDSRWTREIREGSEKRLRSIADARKDTGSLEEVRCGWYRHTGSREDPIGKQTVEWTCLIGR